MQSFWQDLRYGARMLAKRPGFTLIAVLTLALGIGANTAIFSVVNAVLLRPLPYTNPDRLVRLWETQPGLDQAPFSPGEFLDYQAQNQSFEQIAAYRWFSFTLLGTAQPMRVEAGIVSANFFALLGARPQRGRLLQADDGRAGAPRVVVLSHGSWQQHFGGDQNPIGKALNINGESATVIGVLQPDFQFNSSTEIWVNPRRVTPDYTGMDSADLQTERANRYLRVIGRLKDGVSVPQAQADLNAIASRLQQQYPQTNRGHGARLVLLHEQVVGEVKPWLMLLSGAVGLMLLIACANVANLTLVCAVTRSREIAVRQALGASRWRVLRQLLTESVLLSLVGGVCGWLLALWGVQALIALSPTDTPRLAEINPDYQVFGFTLAVSLLVGVVCGLLPAFTASGINLNEALKEGGRSVGAARPRASSLLVVIEVALALVVLIGAGLLVKSFMRLQTVNPGFDSSHLLTLRLWLSEANYGTEAQRIAFLKDLESRLTALPSIEGVAIANDLPIQGRDSSTVLNIEGRSFASPTDRPLVGIHSVNAYYFDAMRIPLLRGRALSERDVAGAPIVIVINESLARRFWPNEEAVGKRVRLGGESNPWMEIVGVVGDVRHEGLTDASAFETYFSHLQAPRPYMAVTIRSALERTALTSAVRHAVQTIDRNEPVYDLRTMDELIVESVALRRLSLWLFSLFALISLLLAAVGLYGVMAYLVTQQTNEIGLRIALGAQPYDVLKLVIRQGLKLAFGGILLGLGGAFALARLMKTLLFDVSATDPLTFAVIPLALGAVVLLACWIPARRATKVDPMIALRCE